MDAGQQLSNERPGMASLGKRRNLGDQLENAEGELFCKVKKPANDASLGVSERTEESRSKSELCRYVELLEKTIGELAGTIRSQAHEDVQLWKPSVQAVLEMEEQILAMDKEIRQQRKQNAEYLVRFAETEEERLRSLQELSMQLSEAKFANVELEHEKFLVEKKLEAATSANEVLGKQIEDLTERLNSSEVPVPGESEKQYNAKLLESMNIKYSDYKRLLEENKRLQETNGHFRNYADELVKLQKQTESMLLKAEADEKIMKDLAAENSELKVAICSSSTGMPSTSAVDSLLQTIASLRRQLGELIEGDEKSYDFRRLVAPEMKDAESQTDEQVHSNSGSHADRTQSLFQVQSQGLEVAKESENTRAAMDNSPFVIMHFKDNPVDKARRAYGRKQLGTSETAHEIMDEHIANLQRCSVKNSSYASAPDIGQSDMEAE